MWKELFPYLLYDDYIVVLLSLLGEDVLAVDDVGFADLPGRVGKLIFVDADSVALDHLAGLTLGREDRSLHGQKILDGAGEFVLNSIDADGTKNGYEIPLTKMISDNVGVPVVASGGAGRPEHLEDVFKNGNADAALIASMVHYGDYTVQGIKEYLASAGVPMRM